MKTTILILVLLFSNTLWAQIKDDFDDNNLSSSPQWYGDLEYFIIDNGRLRSNSSSTTNTIYISTPVESLNEQEWQIYTKLDFSPSASNKLIFYLMSDSQNLSEATEAVYLEIGQSGSDVFRLVYEVEGNKETILESTVAFSSSIEEYIKVIKTANNHWELYLKSTAGDYLKDTEAIFREIIIDQPYSGLMCKHTSTRSDKFYFDDFYCGPLDVDKQPPMVNEFSVDNGNVVSLIFSETLGDAIERNNFLLNQEYYPEMVNVNTNTITVQFDRQFKEGENRFQVLNIPDKAGNVLEDTILYFDYYPIAEPVQGDIIINELMADPTPAEDLPEAEYVELWNRSEKHFDLSQLELNDNRISEEIQIFKRNTFIILCRQADKEHFSAFGEVAGMLSWDVLSNTGDEVILTHQGELLDEIFYTNSWYYSGEKSNGGFSLERRAADFPCDQKSNWSASQAAAGGTPGKINSLEPINDLSPPFLRSAMALDSVTIELQLNESINPVTLKLAEIKSEELVFDSYDFKDPQTILVKSTTPFPPNQFYTVTLNGIVDCYGNLQAETSDTFILPDRINVEDILLSEILFDPFPSGVDFIEIHNKSNKYLDLRELQLSNDSLRYYTITDQPEVIKPGAYIAFTTDSNLVINDYPHAQNVLQVPAMPPMPNAGGDIFLFAGNLLLDHFSFSPDIHLPFLESEEGVSLERISFDTEGNNPENWHSAGSTAGYATPGIINSQYLAGEEAQKAPLTLSTSYITPDQNGDKDFVLIHYSFSDPDLIGTFIIYDPYGRAVRSLANNATLASTGQFRWDGADSNGQLVKTGHYILLADLFSTSGKTYRYKEKIVVVRR